MTLFFCELLEANKIFYLLSEGIPVNGEIVGDGLG